MKKAAVIIKEVRINEALLGEIEPKGRTGLILDEFRRYQADVSCEIHLIKVLVEGTEKTFWRPIVENNYTFESPGFWESGEYGGRGRGHTIKVLQ